MRHTPLKKDRERGRERERPGKQARDHTLDRKTIYYDDGAVQHQYPARPGYHGSDDEKDLNPEE